MPYKLNLSCPCCSGKEFINCCEPYLTGKAIPETAVALMRSRYTAYSKANINYIIATMREKAAENFNADEALEWAKTAKWCRLKVLRHFPHPQKHDYYFVEFTAFYIWKGQMQTIHEISEFRQIQNRWYYIAGQH